MSPASRASATGSCKYLHQRLSFVRRVRIVLSETPLIHCDDRVVVYGCDVRYKDLACVGSVVSAEVYGCDARYKDLAGVDSVVSAVVNGCDARYKDPAGVDSIVSAVVNGCDVRYKDLAGVDSVVSVAVSVFVMFQRIDE